MVVTDAHVEALRRWLVGETDIPQLSEPVPGWMPPGDLMLARATFAQLAYRRFADRNAVADYVAGLQDRSSWLAENLNQETAVALLLELAQEPAWEAGQLPASVRGHQELILARELVQDDKLDSTQLTRLLTKARDDAEDWATPRER